MDTTKDQSKKSFHFSSFWKQKIVGKVVILLIISAIIGYLLAPKIIFQPILYQEGDIIRQTISVEEDLLIPDNVSTALKQKQLLEEIRITYDFDPDLLQKTDKLIRSAFQMARNEAELIKVLQEGIETKKRELGTSYFNLVEKQQQITKRISFYDIYRSVLENRLEELQQKPKLTSRDFILKQKMDAVLNSANLMFNNLTQQGSLFEKQLAEFPKQFDEQSQNIATQLKNLEIKRSALGQHFINALQISVEEKDLGTLNFDFYQNPVEQSLLAVLKDILPQQIILTKANLRIDKKVSIELRNLQTGNTIQVNNLNSIIDLNQAVSIAKKSIEEQLETDKAGKIKPFLLLLSEKLIRPTVTENKQAYETAKNKITTEMSPVFFGVKKGEIIARSGDRATRQQVELIKGYYNVISNLDQIPKVIGFVLVVLISLSVVYLSFLIRGDAQMTFKNLLLMGLSIVITMMLTKGIALLGNIVETQYLSIQDSIYQYLLPIALSSMLISILINFEIALLAGLLTSLFITIMLQGNLFYFTFGMMGSIVGSLPITRFESRYSIMGHGLKISAINMPMVIIIYLIETNQIGASIWINLLAALLGGLLTAITASVLLPFFESLFDITTNLKLLELSNMNHPALKELIFHAAGTYQHSILVGNLAEAAANSVNANALLARVSSYYHDIGKGVDSHYFIENKPQNAKNIHDEMDPYVSAQMIIDHLKKGAEIADKYRLGSAIKDILLQHHGTAVVKFFYHKAQEQAKEKNLKEEVDIKKFMYPGPKPQTIEAAIVMLADAAEASTKSIEQPTQELIIEMINKVGWNILEAGQLDESGISLQKFRATLDTFAKVLTSIHHHRIKYPDEVSSSNKNLQHSGAGGSVIKFVHPS